METHIKQAAQTLAAGMVISACIFLLAVYVGTGRVSRALSQVGLMNVVSPFRVEVEQSGYRPTGNILDRDKFIRDLVNALTTAKPEDNRSIGNVAVTDVNAPVSSASINVRGTLSRNAPDEACVFSAELYPDRFGGFQVIIHAAPKDRPSESQQIPGNFYIK